MRKLILAVLPLTVAACSSSGGTGTPAPGTVALAYTMSTNGAVTYEIFDTAQVVMDMMGQSIQVNVQSSAVVDIDLVRSGTGLGGTLTFQAVDGSMTNSMGPSMTISDSDKPGPTGLTVDARGVVTVIEKPELTTVMRQVFGSDAYVQRLFMRVPGRAVPAGTTWTDTVTINDEAAGMHTEMTNVVTSTLRGDTTVAGTRLLVIDSDITSTQRISGTQEGIEIRQTLTGTSTARTLWDPARGLVVERAEAGTSTGDMELPAMGMSGIPVNIRSVQAMRMRS